MSVDPIILATILGMALVTYATRLGGYLVVSRLHQGPRTRRFLEHLPGCTFAALSAPIVFQGGPPEWAAAAATVLIARLTGQVLPALAAGVALVWAGRQAMAALAG